MNPLPESGRLDASTIAKMRELGLIKPSQAVQTEGPPLQDRRTPSRITTVGSIYYMTRDGQPHVVQIRSARNQQTEEQAYGPRKVTIGDQWTSLDAGWIKVCGLLIVTNEEGRRRQRIPTPEEQQEIDSKVIEIAFLSPQSLKETDEPRTMHSKPKTPLDIYPALLLPPGESVPVCPVDLRSVMIRCQNGQAKITINILPG